MTPGARIQAAIGLLREIEQGAAPADEILSHWARRSRYAGGGDRRAVRDLVFAVIRHRRQLEWWVERIGPQRSPRILTIAALVLLQGWDAERIAGAFGSGGYAGTPLADDEREILQVLAGASLSHPKQPRDVGLNYPAWLDPALAARFGDTLEAEAAALAGEAAVDLRVNTLKADRETARRRLREDGMEAAPTRWSPIGLRLAGRAQLGGRRAWRDGLIEPQDEGSQVAALLVGARPGEAVADFCAGGGGKTLALAAAMGNRGRLAACDTSAARLRQGRARYRRAGAMIVEERVLTGEDDPWVAGNAGAFDRVLVDVPCSGSGAWRRNPDAKWRLAPDMLAELQARQDRLLTAASPLVKPGGRLIYATCSLLRGENEDRVAEFLARDGGFRLLPVPAVWRETIGDGCPVTGDYLMLTPHRHGTDGFFAGVLERISERNG